MLFFDNIFAQRIFGWMKNFSALHFSTFSFFAINLKEILVKSSRPEMFFKKRCFFLNLAKFTGKHLSQSLFLNKVAGQQISSANAQTQLLKKNGTIFLLDSDAFIKKTNDQLSDKIFYERFSEDKIEKYAEKNE